MMTMGDFWGSTVFGPIQLPTLSVGDLVKETCSPTCTMSVPGTCYYPPGCEQPTKPIEDILPLAKAVLTSNETGASSLTPSPAGFSFKCCPFALAFVAGAALMYLMKRK